jgi:hypothetical protein
MKVKIHKFGHTSSEADILSEKLSSVFSKMDVLVDDSRTQVIIKSIQTEKFIPKVKYPGLRMDVVKEQIGILAVMGNKANIGARCFSTLYHANSGAITEQIFVAHSPANAWWREYRNKDSANWKYSTGNRLSSYDLRKMIDELYPELMRIPVTILSLEQNDSKINYSRFCEINGRVPITFP